MLPFSLTLSIYIAFPLHVNVIGTIIFTPDTSMKQGERSALDQPHKCKRNSLRTRTLKQLELHSITLTYYFSLNPILMTRFGHRDLLVQHFNVN